MWYPTIHAKKFLNTALNLSASGQEQDWEIELADHRRIKELIDFYAKSDLPQDCEEALVALILASFEDAIWVSQFDEEQWHRFSAGLLSNYSRLENVLTPWATNDDNDEFAISKRVRALLT